MIVRVNGTWLKDMFMNWDRDYFSTTACDALVEYYDEVDENTEVDIISLCCDWNEYGYMLSIRDMVCDYGYLLDTEPLMYDIMEEDERDGFILELVEELENNTTVIELSNGNCLVGTF